MMRVVIAEDAGVLREGLTRLLEDHGHEVCAAVADGDALLAAVAEHKPDVAVVDIRMPPTHTDEGLRAALQLRQDHHGTGVLMFSQYVETRYASRLLAGDAAGVGYLLRDGVADVADFVAALERVADGGTALDPEVVSQLFRASRRTEGLNTLTRRERDVLGLLAEGRSNAGISAALFISGGAVEKHVASIFGKLGLPPSEGDNRRGLAVLRYLGGVPEEGSAGQPGADQPLLAVHQPDQHLVVSAGGQQPRLAAGPHLLVVLPFGRDPQPVPGGQHVFDRGPGDRVVGVPGRVEIGGPQRPAGPARARPGPGQGQPGGGLAALGGLAVVGEEPLAERDRGATGQVHRGPDGHRLQ